MQASLCLPTKNHHHFTLNSLQSRTISNSHNQLNPRISLFFRTGLYGGHSRRLTTPVMRAHMTPPEDNRNRIRKDAARSAAIAATVLACTIGVMCTSFRAKAYTFLFMSKPDTKHEVKIATDAKEQDETKKLTIQQMSIKALQLIFEGKWGDQTIDWLTEVQKLLSDTLESGVPPRDFPTWKKELNIERADRKALIKFVDKWKKIEQQADKFYIGLVLIDLFIIEGEYRKAFEVCEEMDKCQMNDIRHQIRKAVVAMMLEENIISEVQKGKLMLMLLNAINIGAQPDSGTDNKPLSTPPSIGNSPQSPSSTDNDIPPFEPPSFDHGQQLSTSSSDTNRPLSPWTSQSRDSN